MTGPKARDLMTSEVVTIPPDMPVTAIARLLAMRGITAVPVVDHDGAVLGMVTAADLTSRLSAEPEEEPSWLRRLFADPAKAADRYARVHGFVAEEVMTTDVPTVAPDTAAGEIAATFERQGLRRVLVIEGERLVGVVSRSDLLRAVTCRTTEPIELPDTRIRTAVLAAMRREPWADIFRTLVDVQDGIVEFHGFAPGREVRRALRVLAEQVPGVKGVRDRTEPVPPLDQVLL